MHMAWLLSGVMGSSGVVSPVRGLTARALQPTATGQNDSSETCVRTVSEGVVWLESPIGSSSHRCVWLIWKTHIPQTAVQATWNLQRPDLKLHTEDIFQSVASSKWLLCNSPMAPWPWKMKDMTCIEMLTTTYNWSHQDTCKTPRSLQLSTSAFVRVSLHDTDYYHKASAQVISSACYLGHTTHFRVQFMNTERFWQE